MNIIHKILAPTDFSPEGERALDYAVEMATRFAARLVVFHAYALPVVAMPDLLSAQVMPTDVEMRTAVDGELAKMVARAKKLGASDVGHASAGGNAAIEIVRAAKSHGCDLIVMGTHGRGGFQHLLLGSVAEKVVRSAACPVLTVGPKSGR